VAIANGAIRLEHVTKRYAKVVALNDLSLSVEHGVFGFLGPNGAGKSSTMRMIGAVSPPSAGELRVFGLDPATEGPRIRARIGVCPQDDTVDAELRVRENLVVYGRFFGLSRAECRARADELLDFVSLRDRADAKVETLSGGMKRRLTIARALVNSPELLLLDEPTTGLDPQARHLVWERLFRLKQRGVTLVLTTHYMDEAEQLCDRLVVMDGGRIVAEGSPQRLIEQYSTREVTELRFADDGHADLASAVTERVGDLAARVEVLPDRLLLYAADGEAAAAAVSRGGLRPTSVLVRRSSLEDVFLRLTGRSLVD
jgi:lipooligosaccharide transport system ATP-binding protein